MTAIRKKALQIIGELAAATVAAPTPAPTRPRLPVHPIGDRLSHLTPRELDVLKWFMLGLANDAIAKHMLISTNTVKAFLRLIYGKTGARTRTELLNWCTINTIQGADNQVKISSYKPVASAIYRTKDRVTLTITDPLSTALIELKFDTMADVTKFTDAIKDRMLEAESKERTERFAGGGS